LPIISATLLHFSPSPPVEGFVVISVNVYPCSDGANAIYGVKNISSIKFESSEIRIDDLTNDRALFGPNSSNNPFRTSDRDCHNGGDQLKSGQTLFTGAPLGSNRLSTHTIQAAITLCTSEDLGGDCYTNLVEFVMP